MRVLGIVILIVGLVVFGFGISPSQAITEQTIEAISGRNTYTTMWYVVGGITMIVGGGAITIFGKKNRKPPL
jgi:hypothetical protein